MFSEKLTRTSAGGWLLLVLVVTLAIAMVLSITFADNAEAKKKKRIRVQVSTFVFCDQKTLEQCTNTIDPSKATMTFSGSGPIQTHEVSFRSIETATDFPSCVFFGQVSDTDEYVCKTKTTRDV